MKKMLAVLFSTVLLLSVMALPVTAATSETEQITSTVEFLEDGSYVVTEIETTSNAAYGYGSIYYLGYFYSRNVTLSCDSYGNLY